MNFPEITKLIDETDDLESARLEGEMAKKVAFKEFDEDDLLADLLSDEEDFQQNKQKRSANNKSNLMEDLFGLKTSDKSTSNVEPNNRESMALQNSVVKKDTEDTKQVKSTLIQNDWLGLLDQPAGTALNSTVAQQQVHKSSSTTVKNDQIMLEKSNSDGKLKLPQDEAKKSLLMQDLFGNKVKPSGSIDLGKSTTSLGSEITSSRSTLDMTNQGQSSIPVDMGYAPTISTTRESKRGRRASAVIDDPLGLLSASSVDQQFALADEPKKEVVPKTMPKSDELFKKNSPDLPEWLGGTKSTKDKTVEDAKHTSLLNNDPNRSTSPMENVKQLQKNDINTDEIPKNIGPIPDYMSFLFGAQIDQQATIITMQQQEHELRTATTLSQQNQQLNNYLEKLKSKLDEQEKQFKVLIQKQIERQILLDTHMKVQQERLNHYIQALTTQPLSTPMIVTATTNNDHTDQIVNNNQEESESLIQKLRLERTCLENTLDSLKQNHEKEINILEDSYRKQILFLEAGMEKLEKRMQEEAESLETDYRTKIEKLIDERVQMENTYKEQIAELKKAHREYIDEINARHASNLQLILKEHAETIENISKAKNLECDAVAQITTHKTDIQHLLETANVIIDNITSMQKRIDEKDMKIEKDRENYLKLQEENMELQKRELIEQKNILGKERGKVVEIANKLDLNVSQLTAEFHIRTEQNKQAEERLKAKEEILMRERELFEEKIKWERQHLQALKDSWQMEQERQLKALADEREALAAKKAKVEVFDRLKIYADDAEKLEVEATLKAAQDAIAIANQEKQKWLGKLNELQIQHQNFQQKENHLMLRAKELEDLTQSALLKREEGLRALKEAKRIENQYKEKLRHLQTQLEALSQRENKIATEKLSLARERLALRTAVTEKPVKESDNLLSTLEIPTHFKDIVDPHLLVMKLNLNHELSTANKQLEALQM